MKTYNCPYCNKKLIRDKLVKHIEKEHDYELPLDYTAYRLVYDIVNNKQGHGSCQICGKDTQWNEKRQKYNRLCGDPKCYEEVKRIHHERMLRVYNKVHLLDDPKQQEKMLAHRKIAGEYKWSDGTKFTYMGSFEKNLLEFMDKTLEFKSTEIIAPGPTLEYVFQGKTHHWITDFLIIPYNLIIEVKDGGDNPNKREMPIYRAKQIEKEKMITNQGTYNYLRLTNNNFAQLLGVLAELKMNVVDEVEDKIYRINEDANKSIVGHVMMHESNALLGTVLSGLILETSTIYKIKDGRIIDDPDGEEVLEAYIIKPHLKNKHYENKFVDSVQKTKDLVKKCHMVEYCTFFNANPENIMDGVIIGVKTSL